jgi:excisionase family DNA binding protein
MTTVFPRATPSGATPNSDQERLLESIDALHATIQKMDRRLDDQSTQYYTVTEFAKLVKRSDYTVRRWIKLKKINAFKVKGSGPKGRWLIPRDQLARVLDSGLGASL